MSKLKQLPSKLKKKLTDKIYIETLKQSFNIYVNRCIKENNEESLRRFALFIKCENCSYSDKSAFDDLITRLSVFLKD